MQAQANPVKPSTGRAARSGQRVRPVLAAQKPLIVPIRVRISGLRLAGIGVLDMHRTYGVSLSFKNDPFKSVKINTSFDENPAIADMLQSSLEDELRELFTTGIPELVHKLSLQKIREAQPTFAPQSKPKPRLRRGGSGTVKSMPSSPELRREVSHNPQPPKASSRPLSRLDSNPSPASGVAKQLTTHHLQHNTLSPYSVADEHVMHRYVGRHGMPFGYCIAHGPASDNAGAAPLPLPQFPSSPPRPNHPNATTRYASSSQRRTRQSKPCAQSPKISIAG